MKTSILATVIAFALGISLASDTSAAICDEHDKHGKKKRGKTVAHGKSKRGKSKDAKIANASRKPPQHSQLPVRDEKHHDHSADSNHSAHDEQSETPLVTGSERRDSPGKIKQAAVRMNIPDLEVTDQDNRRVRFYS
ncbi:MAG: hypothetical protein ABIV48_10995, partial [Pyrinomonadaceae bacterium]